MKKLFFQITLLLTGILLTVSSCKKDDEPETNADLIIGTWKITAATVSPTTIFGDDLYATWDNCDRDDLIIYGENGSLVFDEGASKCETTAPQTISGTYIFNTDLTIITASIDSQTTSYNVVSIDDSQMVLKETVDVLGNTSTVTYTFDKQ